MAEFPAMPLWTDAYLADTRHLNQAEHGAYLLLLMTAWRTSDCALPNDDQLLAKYAGCSIKLWMKQKPVIMKFFRLCDDGMFRQKRQVCERSWVEKKRKTNKTNALARYMKNNQTDSATALRTQHDARATPIPTPKATPVDSQPGPTSEPSFETPDPMINTCPASPDTPPEIDFDFFWSCWRLKGAKRGSKDRARAIYLAAIKDGVISHKDLCVHVERVQRFYEASGTPTSKQLHPATWLYQKRWNDELVIDEPERKRGNGFLKSDAELANEIAADRRRRAGYGGADSDASRFASEYQGQEPHSPLRSRHRD